MVFLVLLDFCVCDEWGLARSQSIKVRGIAESQTGESKVDTLL
jgi:hypothetical protein